LLYVLSPRPPKTTAARARGTGRTRQSDPHRRQGFGSSLLPRLNAAGVPPAGWPWTRRLTPRQGPPTPAGRPAGPRRRRRSGDQITTLSLRPAPRPAPGGSAPHAAAAAPAVGGAPPAAPARHVAAVGPAAARARGGRRCQRTFVFGAPPLPPAAPAAVVPRGRCGRHPRKRCIRVSADGNGCSGVALPARGGRGGNSRRHREHHPPVTGEAARPDGGHAPVVLRGAVHARLQPR